MAVVRDGRAVFAAVAGALPAVGPHQPFHGAPGHVVALAAQPDPHLARTQRCGELAGLRVLALGADQRRDLLVAPLLLRWPLVGPLVVRGRADLDAVLGQHGAHGLDSPAQPGPTIGTGRLVILVLGDEPNHRLAGRSVKSARGAVALPLRFPGLLPEPGVHLSMHRALHKPHVGSLA